MSAPTRSSCDVLILGSGAAGLAAALNLPTHLDIRVLSKEGVRDSSSNRAQGGIASVTDPADSIEAHVEDTCRAGADLCDEDIVRFVVANAAVAVANLVDLGLKFDREQDRLHLTKEGGHSFRRVLHVADATGQAITSTLLQQVVERPNIHVLTNRVAVDVVTSRKLGQSTNRVLGAYVYNRDEDAVEVVSAPHVILATGGASKTYVYTSNPDGATGDGIAIAWRAGCRISNMEFNQFHPTCLFHPQARSFLISEAVRGEGGLLVLPNGERFMQRFDVRGELAPRDVVARAIDYEMKRLGSECVFLDVTHIDEKRIHNHFPTIYRTLANVGIDMCKEPIPIVPAAHYTCGGVLVDADGATDVPGLYAIGETACTGLHGANRLASNSLLECLVYARAAAQHINAQAAENLADPDLIPDWDESRVTDSDEDVVITHNWAELRRFMWDYVGIVRTDKRLERAANRIELLKREVHEYYSNYRVNPDLLELRNLIHVSELIVRSAQWRKESRGLHYSLDHPQLNEEATPSVIHPIRDPLDVLQPVSLAGRQSASL